MQLNYTNLKLLPYLIGNVKLFKSPLSKNYTSNSYNIQDSKLNLSNKEATEANTSLFSESSIICPTNFNGNIFKSITLRNKLI